MDGAFLLDEAARANFIQTTIRSFGCSYICLWSYVPLPSNCLLFLDGYYHEEETSQPSSSSETLAQRLFYEYRNLVINVDNDLIPGLAFKNNFSFFEFHESDLQTQASADVQRDFYTAARIKSSFFFGSIHGEIELGFSDISKANNAMEIIRILFPGEFSGQVSEQLQPIMNQTPHSSSSSSLRSLSMGSPECPSFTFNIPTTPFLTRSTALSSSSSPPPPPYSLHSSRNLPEQRFINPEDSAFRKYSPALSSAMAKNQSSSRQSMLKRSISFLRYLTFLRIRDYRRQPSLPTSTQLHRMMSERKRREKLNESFQDLRSLLPAGTKKDKTSVLETTREYLTSLKATVEDLTRKNQLLEAQLLPRTESKEETAITSSNERVSIRVSDLRETASSSSPRRRVINLQVVVREELPMADMALSVLQFLKQINYITIASIEANTQNFNLLNIRLIIEDGEWDEATFQEAIRRIVSDQLL